ncbi:MAG: LysM peptidoglycan-binding domain-containing protein [Gammaproteobacteria bacterium]|nr:LysM peptidoglycan-binding domain-containing protein [Gammaproteobacteria bacterium]
MKKTDLLKMAAVAVLSTGLMVGCASDTKEEPAPVAEKQDCPSAAAKNAIYSAKIKLARAEKLGYAWRDTGKMIKDAEKAAAKCDNDKAIELANMASEQAENAIAQYHSEQKRYNEQHGSTDGAMASADSEYTVVSGDNLWDISGKQSIYGNPYQWPLIYKANSDQIKDADLIYPGQVFSIPNASAGEIDAAVQHAKTRGAWSVGAVEQSDQDYLAQ